MSKTPFPPAIRVRRKIIGTSHLAEQFGLASDCSSQPAGFSCWAPPAPQAGYRPFGPGLRWVLIHTQGDGDATR